MTEVGTLVPAEKYGTLDRRQCSRCSSTKPWYEFSRSATNRTGLNSFCRKCDQDKEARRREQQAAIREATLAVVTPGPGLTEIGGPIPEKPPSVALDQKECTHCGRTLPWFDFAFASKEKHGLQNWCRACHKASELRGRGRAVTEPTAPEAKAARVKVKKEAKPEERPLPPAKQPVARAFEMMFERSGRFDSIEVVEEPAQDEMAMRARLAERVLEMRQDILKRSMDQQQELALKLLGLE